MDDENKYDGYRPSSEIFGGFDTSYETRKPSRRRGVSPEIEKKRGKRKKKIEKQRRRKAARRRRRLTVLVIALILLLFGYLFFSSSLFTISEIDVRNNTMKTDKQLIKESGVKVGDNIFSHTGHSVKKAIMAKNPYISGVTVSRRLPNEYTITVMEHIPTAAIKYKGKFLILDEKGRVIGKEDTQITATEITGIKIKSYEQGDFPSTDDDEELTKMMEFIDKVNDSGLFFKKLDIVSALTVHGYVTDTLICSGAPDDITANLEGIKAVIFDLGQKGVEAGTINVGNDGFATFSPA
ncbi:MAG: FtsQ-type POTRA domain-containing protein [Anaerovoracaceae bacterium]|nr:FtsQ-type POTRA domain-containing protein [Bacillota bacterium]MDY2670169.1 FtsQ-type POTRA domain-containing protein [Anaerovoracaceae bacterium]